ncbi:TonB-dependent receptor plug domain-containing protein, partial [Algoriphagus sp.]|uniref:TonB-dependent receptor n=1 Tax=Algoriphagus sp. TaxID=1872435 RepID=UPI0032975A8F
MLEDQQYFTIKFLAPFLLSILLCYDSYALQLDKRGVISGVIVENGSNSPLPFASIGIYTTQDSLIGGGLSNEDGRFQIDIEEGQYYAIIEFMGYEPHKTEILTISYEAPAYELGEIKMNTVAGDLDEVIVQGEKTLMELSLDKRIFNVGKDLANAGGTANDILMNLPSVAVDPEGNVRLRGSSNVRILIDGKPSGLVSFKGGAGLRQLPANMVDRVEVITNPSARYEAEGMAGVINIILKKDNSQGFNASFELIGGTPTNFGFTTNLNYRHKKINWFVNYGFAYPKSPNI